MKTRLFPDALLGGNDIMDRRQEEIVDGEHRARPCSILNPCSAAGVGSFVASVKLV